MTVAPCFARDIMQRNLLHCHLATPADAAARIAAEQAARELVVTDDEGFAVGTINRFDLLVLLERAHPSRRTRPLGELLRNDVVVCTPDEPLDAVVRTMLRQRAMRVLVVEYVAQRMRPLGFISIGDVIRQRAATA